MIVENNTYVSQPQINAYLSNEYSFIPDLMPSDAVRMPTVQVFYLLEKKLGADYFKEIKYLHSRHAYRIRRH